MKEMLILTLILLIGIVIYPFVISFLGIVLLSLVPVVFIGLIIEAFLLLFPQKNKCKTGKSGKK